MTPTLLALNPEPRAVKSNPTETSQALKGSKPRKERGKRGARQTERIKKLGKNKGSKWNTGL